MDILKNGHSNIKFSYENNNIKLDNIIDNLYNFSNYINNKIDCNCIKEILELLKNEEKKEIYDASYRLAKYNEYIEQFNKKLEKAKKHSIFDFSIISFIVIEREDYEAFQKEREECPNKGEKILFYRASNILNSNNLNGIFNLESNTNLYFTNSLDYGWFDYNSEEVNTNINRIPRLNEIFNLIACYIYYNENFKKKVINNNILPNKNEMTLTYIGAELETIEDEIPNKEKFYGTEYKIGDLNQICPLLSLKLKRNEFCIIWRDDNFSSNGVYYNDYDKKFKKFLDEMKTQAGKYNLYPCETKNEAITLVERKKYNKIILISNVGKNNKGVEFIEKAREIINNDVIVLFIAFRLNHLDWIQNYKNALFSNEPEFSKEYLKCFNYDCYEYERINIIQNLIKKMENHYKVHFNFDEKFLDFPNYKKIGKYSDLSFNVDNFN
jgi:hypothetical protein